MSEETTLGWEHWIAFAALVVAIITEAVSAYCIARERIDEALQKAEPVPPEGVEVSSDASGVVFAHS